MKKLPLAILVGLTAFLSGCCECMDDYPSLKVDFKDFSVAELKTIYLVSDGLSDTCYTCVDTISGSMFIPALSYSRHQILSDSLALNKTIQVNNIKTESSRFFLCEPCVKIKGVNYEYEGNKYTSEPIVITK